MERDFIAAGPERLWVADIKVHRDLGWLPTTWPPGAMVQRLEDQLGAQMGRHAPTHHPPTPVVDDYCVP